MEASETQVPAEGESADGTPVAVGDSGLGQPLAASDQHNPDKPGPASAPDPAMLSGDPLAGQDGGEQGGDGDESAD